MLPSSAHRGWHFIPHPQGVCQVLDLCFIQVQRPLCSLCVAGGSGWSLAYSSRPGTDRLAAQIGPKESTH